MNGLGSESPCTAGSNRNCRWISLRATRAQTAHWRYSSLAASRPRRKAISNDAGSRGSCFPKRKNYSTALCYNERHCHAEPFVVLEGKLREASASPVSASQTSKFLSPRRPLGMTGFKILAGGKESLDK